MNAQNLRDATRRLRQRVRREGLIERRAWQLLRNVMTFAPRISLGTVCVTAIMRRTEYLLVIPL
jgi:hypothetical protein